MENYLPFLVIILLCGVVFLAGFIDSIAGGGGLISLPSLLLAGLPPQFALGTNRFLSSFGTASALIYFARKKEVDWKLAGRGLVFSLGGAVLGTKVALVLDPEFLKGIILFLLPIAAILCFLPLKERKAPKAKESLVNFFIIGLVFSLIGFYDGFFGPGTGTFIIMALHFILGKNLLAASGTAKVFNLASNTASMFTFLINGKILLYLALPLALANISGNLLGSRMAVRGGAKFIKKILLLPLALLFLALAGSYFGFFPG